MSAASPSDALPVPAPVDPIHLTLPDGQVRTYARGTTGLEVAASIGKRLAADALAIRLDGELRDLARGIERDGALAIVTRKAPEALELIRHDAAHVMAEAVQSIWPDTQVTIGPSIENGFYYDFARDEPFTPDDLAQIEAAMRGIVQRAAKFEREVWDRNDAIAYFQDKGETYKAELIRDLPASETITIYRQGAWLDLCRGPHMPSTGHVGQAFKLTKVAGAYWRGDHRNRMLQRIYGTAWRDQGELEAYLHQLEEAEKRDHRRLGREMNLFHIQEEAVGQVFWHPKGHTLWRALEAYIRRRVEGSGYQEVKTPLLLDRKLWETSGHWEKYHANMFIAEVEEGEGTKRSLALKPMNCPGHVQIFAQGLKSYRDLPLRMAEFGSCHRYEPSGALHGIMRVRGFTQDDAHIFCTPEQMPQEAAAAGQLIFATYRDFGFERIEVKLSTRPEQRIGEDAVWDKAEEQLAEACRMMGVDYTINEGEGAFYGPKLEFTLFDTIGRGWQCGTVQIDFNLPERFQIEYVAEDGSRQRPAMLHRAVLGSLERFIGVLIEHYAGRFPLWLAPVQAMVATIVSDANEYAEEVRALARRRFLRVDADTRNEKINLKVREHSLAKVPVMLVVGRREAENRTVALRRLGSDAQEVLSLDEALARLADEAMPPDLRRAAEE